MCACGSEIETTKHFLFRCHLCFPQRPELFENLKKIGSSFLNLNVKDKIFYYMILNQQLLMVSITLLKIR